MCVPIAAMKIIDYLSPDDVLPALASRTQHSVLEEFAGHLARMGRIRVASALVDALVERENLGSTGIGHGVAIPHGRLKGLSDILIAFGRSLAGVPFDAHDGQPVHLFFLLVAPEDSAGLHLKALARISRIVKSPDCRKALMNAPDREAIYQVISEEDEKH